MPDVNVTSTYIAISSKEQVTGIMPGTRCGLDLSIALFSAIVIGISSARTFGENIGIAIKSNNNNFCLIGTDY